MKTQPPYKLPGHSPVHKSMPPSSPSVRLANQTRSLNRAYAVALTLLAITIAAGYLTLHQVMAEQTNLTNLYASTSQLQTEIGDSVQILSDYKSYRAQSEVSPRLLNKVRKRMGVSFTRMHLHRDGMLAGIAQLPQRSRYAGLRNAVFTDKGGLDSLLEAYLQRVQELTRNNAPAGNDALWIPVEATGARDGPLLQGYTRISDGIRQALIQSSRNVSMLLTMVYALVALVLCLVTLFIFLPMSRRLGRAYERVAQTQTQLALQAFNDRETGLPNLAGMQEQLQQLTSSHNFDTAHQTFLLLRINNLDTIVTLIGPDNLPAFLQSLVARLRYLAQESAWCRCGDAEFALLSNVSREQWTDARLQQWQQQLSTRWVVNSRVVMADVALAAVDLQATNPAHNGTVDSGVSHLSERLGEARLALQHRDLASSPLSWFDSGMRAAMHLENDTQAAIETALKRQEFKPFYQIKVDAISGAPVGMEMLCRWQLPDGSLKSPGQFLPLAEKTGQIVPITWALLEQVVSDINSWWQHGIDSGRVAINAAELVLLQADFVERFQALNRQLPAGHEGLDIEITENVTLPAGNQKLDVLLDAVRREGAHVALDDFGTGFASLSSIIEIPHDVIKIDQSFVAAMRRDGTGCEIVAAMIGMTRKLNKICVIEGVEEEWQWQQLQMFGAHELQGYYFHKPAPARSVLDFLRGFQHRKTG